MDAQPYTAAEPGIRRILQTIRGAGVPDIIDRRLGNHGLHQGLSNGWLASVWVACVCCTGDCRKSGVKEWVGQHQHLLELMLGKCVQPTEFSDGRMGALLRRLSDTAAWHAMETDIHQAGLPSRNGHADQVRLKAATIYGSPAAADSGASPQAERPVARLVAAIEEPAGSLLACDVHPESTPSSPSVSPLVARVQGMLPQPSLLYVCDGVAADLRTRAEIVAHGDNYLAPVSFSGSAARTLDNCIQEAMEGRRALHVHQPPAIPAAVGFELKRRLTVAVDGMPVSWTERVQVLRSLAVAQREMQRLDREMQQAEAALLHLTAAGGRGRRPFTEEEALSAAVSRILEQHGVAGLLNVTWERQEECSRRYIGRGRGGPNRPVRTDTHARYAITSVAADAGALREARYRLGWCVQATSLPAERFPFSEAVARHHEEQASARLASSAGLMEIGPLTVRRDDQVVGLARLVVLARRLGASAQRQTPAPAPASHALPRLSVQHSDLVLQGAG